MPFIEVKILDRRLTARTQEDLAEQVTQAVVNVFGEDIRSQTWVVLTPVPADRWAIGGGTLPRPAAQDGEPRP
ncbi:hypothetical protein GCM10010399_30700 [Dactylosporangium fulvum]|uniref:Tautomerase family protein n=1 Tax=Dactylosporangium fulvum TaxID=53359 RepID=A0ABY5WBC7_9ACTN|nr:tautomerase family protein [Dactylosporangium fulvum]UWP85376.1 tautomerase family protein [Dactylosporangium fulvum]